MGYGVLCCNKKKGDEYEKMTKLTSLVVLLGSCVCVGAQEYKTREVPNAPAFSAIEVSGGDINVNFTQGASHAFAISGPAKLVKATKIKIKENTLFIEYNALFFTGDDNDVTVRVSAPQLVRFMLVGKLILSPKLPSRGRI